MLPYLLASASYSRFIAQSQCQTAHDSGFTSAIGSNDYIEIRLRVYFNEVKGPEQIYNKLVDIYINALWNFMKVFYFNLNKKNKKNIYQRHPSSHHIATINICN